MYLDFAASTPVLPEVREALNEVLDIYGNPSSIHDEGRKANRIIEKAKGIISSRLNCESDEIYFTSGASMSNSLAIQGYIFENPDSVFVTTETEHNDILLCAKSLNCRVEYLKVDKNGLVSIKDVIRLDDSLKGCNVLYSIQMANSETGVIQPMEEISKVVHRYEAHYLHTDATQFVPYYRMDVKKYNVDMFSMSGQKIGCIKGTGLLYVSKGVPVRPIIFGEQGLVGGTENVHGIACLSKAFELLSYPIHSICSMRDKLLELLDEDVILIGSHESRVPNNIMVQFPNVNSEVMLSLLNENGIYASGGSACSSHNGKPSHVLLAMGYDEKTANECVRFTLPKDITEEEVVQVADTINECYHILRCLND